MALRYSLFTLATNASWQPLCMPLQCPPVLAQFSLGPEIPGAQPNSLGLGVGMGNKKPWALGWKLGKFLELVLGIRMFTGKYFLANSHTFCRMHILVSY